MISAETYKKKQKIGTTNITKSQYYCIKHRRSINNIIKNKANSKVQAQNR